MSSEFFKANELFMYVAVLNPFRLYTFRLYTWYANIYSRGNTFDVTNVEYNSLKLAGTCTNSFDSFHFGCSGASFGLYEGILMLWDGL